MHIAQPQLPHEKSKLEKIRQERKLERKMEGERLDKLKASLELKLQPTAYKAGMIRVA
jgi:hypothetical protein